MFSGIVEESAEVVEFQCTMDPYRLSVKSSLDLEGVKVGDSIAIDGVCLTVVDFNSQVLSFDIALETARRSTLGSLKPGERVNLERSLKIGERLHGHFVSGHVDARVKLLRREADGNGLKLTWSCPDHLRGLVAEKGSVSLSGVSMTVGEVAEGEFAVYVVPHTESVTKLGGIKVGENANLEVDLIARYVGSLLNEKDG